MNILMIDWNKPQIASKLGDNGEKTAEDSFQYNTAKRFIELYPGEFA